MKKILIFLLLLSLIGLVLGSCGVKDVVSYCPFCSSRNIKEISTYNTATGMTEIYYECQNPNCGRKFGAGRLPL